MTQKEFHITNLTCEACVKLSKMVLKEIRGVTDVAIDLKTGRVTLSAEREISREEIVKSLAEVDKISDL